MAKSTTNQNEVPPNGEVTEEEAATGVASRFRKIETESYMFNVEKCYNALPAKDRLPLTGHLVGLQDMPPIKGREWKAAVILLTAPVHAIDREKKIVKLPVGSRVLIPATWQLQQHLEKAARSPRLVFEVEITPNKKIDIGGGQTMWTYHLGANPKPVPRINFGVAGLLDAPGTLQLPQGDGTDYGDVPAGQLPPTPF